MDKDRLGDNQFQYVLGQLAHERLLIAEGKPGSGTLVSNLVRASKVRSKVAGGDDEKTVKSGDAPGLKAPSVDEILGNIFVYNFAGHHVTATSLAYAVLLRFAHQEAQVWIAEELDFLLVNESSGTWIYDDVFPRLKRCLAILVGGKKQQACHLSEQP